MPTVLSDNGQTVTILTDDGRQVEVAKDFAGGFGAPATPPGAIDIAAQEPPAPPPPVGVPALVDGGADGAITPPGLEATDPNVPQLPPGQPPGLGVPQLAQPEAPPVAVPSPQPEPVPQIAPDQIPQTAVGAAQNVLGGLQSEAEARMAAAQVESQGATEVVQAYDAAEQKLGEEQQLREMYQSFRAKEEQHLLDSKTAMVDRYANFKLDRNRRYREASTGDKLIGALSIMLGRIGAGMMGQQNNSAFDTIIGELDRDVQMQMADRDALGTAIGMKQQEIADFRQVSSSRVGEYNTRMAAHLSRLERDVSKIAARTQSQTAKANAKVLLSQLQQQGAKYMGDAVTADRTFNEQVRARRAQLGAARQNLEADMKLKGFVSDGAGGWMADSTAAPSGLSLDDQYKITRIEKNQRDAEQVLRGTRVVDSAGRDLGRARYGEAGAKEAADMGTAYEKFRKGMLRLVDVVDKTKTKYKGLGSNRWQVEDRTRIDALRDDLANQLAKLRDPTTANREGEVAIAKQQIPDVDGWASSQNPRVRYDTLVKTADDVYDTYLGTHVENFNPESSPSRRYQSMDTLSADQPDAATRVDMLKGAAAPLASITRSDPGIRASAIDGRRRAIDALGDRSGGITSAEYSALQRKLEGERKAGDLSEPEFTVLMGALTANNLTRGADAPSEADKRQRAGRGSELDQRKKARGY